MSIVLAVLLCSGAISVSGAKNARDSSPAVLSSVTRAVDSGNFKDAERQISSTLSGARLSAEERSALEFERERMRRILLDFALTEEDVLDRIRRQIPDVTAQELAAWDAEGLLEHQVIDGRKLYFNRAPSNLFRLSATAAERRKQPKPLFDSPLETPHPHHKEVRDAALATGKTSVAPRRVSITQAIIVDADAVPAGEVVRAWIPYPRAIPGHQEEIRLLSSTPAKHTIAPESAPQRSIYFEEIAQAGRETRFSVTYELTIFAHYFPIDPDKAVPVEATPDLAPHLGERPPHIVFTDEMRRFSREIVGGEQNPYRIAQKLYAAVDRIPWAGAREYSTISNISDYALRAGHADCGQQTLLLMTLLRLNGIPARWQSGWMFSDGEYDNMHDWGWLYLAPYGWVPMDVTFGRMQSGDPALDGFYLGGLDAYRVVFNDDYGQPFVPEKRHFRSETVDFQRGEVEWRGGNLYFDRWDYEFTARVLGSGE